MTAPAPTLAWEPEDVPPGSRFVPLSSGRTRLLLEGPADGPPVLLVHGLSYPLEVWGPLARHLVAEGFRVCRYDLAGRGLSAYDGQTLTPAALAGHLLELLDAVDLQGPVHLVSLSNSDGVTLEAALAAPARVRQLVWLAPSGLDRRTTNARTRLLRALPFLHARAEALLRERCARRIEGHATHLPADAPVESRFPYRFALRSVREGPGFAQAALCQLLHAHDAATLAERAAQLGRLALPVTAVQFRGERDTDPRGVNVLLAPLPQCRRIELDGTHMGLLEAPAAVAACVAARLRAP